MSVWRWPGDERELMAFDLQMKHPSYLLNPGDMFSVDIESVLYATGAQKGVVDDDDDTSAVRTSPDNDEEGEDELEESEMADDDAEETVEDDEGPEPDVDEATLSARRKKLKDLRDLAKTLQSDTPNLRPKRKIELRALNKQAGRMLSRVQRITDDDITDLETQFEDVLANIRSIPEPPTSPSSARDTLDPAGAPQTKPKRSRKMDADIEAHLERLSLIPNPVDEKKTYATPWRPRNYMAPFAFVPRYLEVNHTICSAVYLRHPVVRPGLAEVPTPFELQSSSLAFAWYLRRR
jgi:ribosomal protein S4